MVTKTTYSTGNEILISPQTARRVGCRVKKPTLGNVVYAGTPLYTEEAVSDATWDRSKALKDENGVGTCVGVLYQDVYFDDDEVTEVNGSLVINGMVDYEKLDTTVQTKVDTAAADLTHIQFVKGRKD